MNRKLLLLLLACAALACHQPKKVIQTKTGEIAIKGDSLKLQDPKVLRMIQPYKVKLDSLMNEVLIQATTDMKKDQPEGALGNMFCDVLMDYARQQSSTKPDFCIMNNGGLRIPVIYAGPVQVRTIFELMPFDNMLVVLELKGTDCKELFADIAKHKGVPESGFTMKIASEQAEDIQINGAAFDESKTYRILISDYLANGGDNTGVLKRATQSISLDMKIRDALLMQLREMAKTGKTLNSKKDGRITFR